ncbi:MAG: hypothetical protein GC129_03640 [Proteobacteria bacterium]|nr:hypothetical protein [Pseudomonadota bacterium]
MAPRKLLVFDLETVPDVAFARKLWPEHAALSDAEMTQHIYNVFLQRTQNTSDFPSPPFHRIVAIGCLLADVEAEDNGTESYRLRKLGCIGEEGDDEATLLQKFFDFGAREGLRLVSYNGLGFDVPVLKLRALHHNLPIRWFMNHLTNKWDNYSSNKALAFHTDLADVFSAKGRAPKLDEVCTLAGLPGKLDVSGAKVYEMFSAGELGQIRDYCETDVLNTYLLYLHHQHLGGILYPELMADEITRVRTYLTKEGKTRAHLSQFLEAWQTPTS